MFQLKDCLLTWGGDQGWHQIQIGQMFFWFLVIPSILWKYLSRPINGKNYHKSCLLNVIFMSNSIYHPIYFVIYLKQFEIKTELNWHNSSSLCILLRKPQCIFASFFLFFLKRKMLAFQKYVFPSFFMYIFPSFLRNLLKRVKNFLFDTYFHLFWKKFVFFTWEIDLCLLYSYVLKIWQNLMNISH